VSIARLAKPTMCIRSDSSPVDAMLKSAGMSLRLARFPDAPKITTAHGGHSGT